MHFEISAAQQTLYKPLTTVQRNSSLFSEAPRVAGKTLRRGQVLRLDKEAFRAAEVEIRRLEKAGSIVVHQVGEEKKVQEVKVEPEKVAPPAPPMVPQLLPPQSVVVPHPAPAAPQLIPQVVLQPIPIPVAGVPSVGPIPPHPSAPSDANRGKKGRH